MFGHALKCFGSQWTWLCVAALGLALLSASTSGLSFAATPELEDTWASLAKIANELNVQVPSVR